MKKLAIGIIVVVVGVGAWLVSSSGKKSNDTAMIASPAIAPATTAQLVVLSAEVSVMSSGESDYRVVTDKEISISQGSSIKTGATGRAAIQYANGAVTSIDENSVLTVVTLQANGDQTKLRLDGGSIFSNVDKKNDTEYYKVQTGNTVASVRGTLFGIANEDDIVHLYTIEHDVQLAEINEQSGEEESATAINITEGTSAQFKFEPGVRRVALARAFKKQVLQDDELRAKFLNRHLSQLPDKIRNRPAPQKLLLRLQKLNTSPSILPKIRVSVSPTPRLSVTPTITKTPTATPTPQTSITATPSATPKPEPKLTSVVPGTIDLSVASQLDFFINGQHLTGSKQCMIGSVTIRCYVVDPQTIVATVMAGQVEAGVYDISIQASTGARLTLPQTLTVK